MFPFLLLGVVFVLLGLGCGSVLAAAAGAVMLACVLIIELLIQRDRI